MLVKTKIGVLIPKLQSVFFLAGEAFLHSFPSTYAKFH